MYMIMNIIYIRGFWQTKKVIKHKTQILNKKQLNFFINGKQFND